MTAGSIARAPLPVWVGLSSFRETAVSESSSALGADVLTAPNHHIDDDVKPEWVPRLHQMLLLRPGVDGPKVVHLGWCRRRRTGFYAHLASTLDSDKDIFGPTEQHMDQMAALSHLRQLIRAAKGKNDVEQLHQALQEMLLFVEKSLGRKG
jgi:hypothetical protein